MNCVSRSAQFVKLLSVCRQRPSQSARALSAHAMDQPQRAKRERKPPAGAGNARLPIVLIGDIHGQFGKLQKARHRRGMSVQQELRLEAAVGEQFSTATVVFLGDYVDRGPDTKSVLEWLSTIKSRHPIQTHAFIMGNHDFGCAAFLGLLPGPVLPGGDAEYSPWRPEQPLWAGPSSEGMHLQGRRWGACRNCRPAAKQCSCVFHSCRMFASYGVEPGDREGLLRAVPETHKAFLRNLAWMRVLPFVEEDTGEQSELMAVHAGLDAGERLASQVDQAMTRSADRHWLEILQGRSNVVGRHPELAGRDGTVVASGHHGGTLLLEPGRGILDTMGGYAERPFTGLVVRGRDPGRWEPVRDE